MIGLVVCTHASLAASLLEAAKMIVGDYPGAAVVGVDPSDGADVIHERIDQAINEVNAGAGVLLLCDMFGGTPSNLSLSFLADDVEVVTGANLPMLLKFYTSREAPLREVAAAIQSHGRDNIRVAGQLLKGQEAAP
jgi:PTS system mannose-specific IIA component